MEKPIQNPAAAHRRRRRRGSGNGGVAAAAQQPAAEKAARQPQRPSRPLRRTPEEEPGLELITRRPPKQKFSNFEEYLAAHGGMTLPLPPDPNESKEPKEAPAPQPMTGESAE